MDDWYDYEKASAKRIAELVKAHNEIFDQLRKSEKENDALKEKVTKLHSLIHSLNCALDALDIRANSAELGLKQQDETTARLQSLARAVVEAHNRSLRLEIYRSTIWLDEAIDALAEAIGGEEG